MADDQAMIVSHFIRLSSAASMASRRRSCSASESSTIRSNPMLRIALRRSSAEANLSSTDTESIFSASWTFASLMPSTLEAACSTLCAQPAHRIPTTGKRFCSFISRGLSVIRIGLVRAYTRIRRGVQPSLLPPVRLSPEHNPL